MTLWVMTEMVSVAVVCYGAIMSDSIGGLLETNFDPCRSAVEVCVCGSYATDCSNLMTTEEFGHDRAGFPSVEYCAETAVLSFRHS